MSVMELRSVFGCGVDGRLYDLIGGSDLGVNCDFRLPRVQSLGHEVGLTLVQMTPHGCMISGKVMHRDQKGGTEDEEVQYIRYL